MLSWSLVAVQFLALALIALTGPLIATPWPLLLIELAGFALMAWALWSLRRSPPHVVPDVRAGATLQRGGPYRWIRHPMYSALLLITLALVLAAPSLLRAAIWLLLLANLNTKLKYEERLLMARFPDYAAYRETTRRLVPFLY